MQWIPWLGYCELIWLLDVAFLAHCAMGGAPTPGSDLFRTYLVQVGAGLFLAGLLMFAIPIALLDASSHRGSRWWLAWLWPFVFLGMLVANVEVGAMVLHPLWKAMKSH